MKHIHFGYGGGLYVYYAGIAQAIYDTVDHDELRRCKIGGTSAGVCGAMALFFSLYHDDLTPTIFFERFVRGDLLCRAKCSSTGLYCQGSRLAHDACVIVYRQLYKGLSRAVRDRLYCVVNELPELRPLRAESFKNETEFATYVSTTLAIPLLFNWRGWNCVGGRHIVDGAFTLMNRNHVTDDPDAEIVCLTIEPIDDPRYKCVNVFGWINYNVKYLLCPTNVNHASLFKRGAAMARLHQDEWRHLF